MLLTILAVAIMPLAVGYLFALREDADDHTQFQLVSMLL